MPRSYIRDELDPEQWPTRLAEIMSEQDALQQGAMMTALLCKEYLTDGSHVLLGGLKGRADLNGLCGVIVGQQVNGRIPVELQIAETPSADRAETTVVRVQIQNAHEPYPNPNQTELRRPSCAFRYRTSARSHKTTQRSRPVRGTRCALSSAGTMPSATCTRSA